MKHIITRQLKYFGHIRKLNTIMETILEGKVEKKKAKD